MALSVNLLTQSTAGKETRVKRALTHTLMTPLLSHAQKGKRGIQIRKVKNTRCSRLRCAQQAKTTVVMNDLKVQWGFPQIKCTKTPAISVSQKTHVTADFHAQSPRGCSGRIIRQFNVKNRKPNGLLEVTPCKAYFCYIICFFTMLSVSFPWTQTKLASSSWRGVLFLTYFKHLGQIENMA